MLRSKEIKVDQEIMREIDYSEFESKRRLRGVILLKKKELFSKVASNLSEISKLQPR